MEIIFAKLPRYLDIICILLAKTVSATYYLELPFSSGEAKEEREKRVSILKAHNIVPLPLEDLPRITSLSEITSDPDMNALNKARQIAPLTLLDSLGGLFSDDPECSKKILVLVHAAVVQKMFSVAGKVNIWAREKSDTRILVIDINFDGFLTPQLEPNVRLLVVPLDIFAQGWNAITQVLRRFIPKNAPAKNMVPSPITGNQQDTPTSRVALVTHHGLSYGNLFPKYVFYSERPDSELNRERILHIDYGGWSSPSEKLNWICMGNHRSTWTANFSAAFAALRNGIFHIRRFRHILGLMILTRSYVIFQSYCSKLDSFPDLKMACIDFEILCPNELQLAFEKKGIRTIAVQERFFTTFSNLLGSTILGYYLCDSPYTAEVMRASPLYAIDHFLPVGQYRSDKLYEAKESPPPQIMESALAKGKKIVTALGFHAMPDWHASRSEPYVNWNAHKHFLSDMIRLSEEIPDIFIILRYKFVDWIALPAFQEEIQRINSSENIVISMDYDKFFVSYDLCAHSDLVIAKSTSIADECLSVGIPVLFHEYTHNTERLIADAFDYSPARIMCYNYQELKERAQIILSGTPNEMTPDYEYLKREVFGGLGDGRVTERIHAHIENLLTSV